MKFFWKFTLQMVAYLLFFSSCEKSDRNNDEEEIRKMHREYEKSYLKKDPKVQSAYWDENATYSNPATGVYLQGRKEIEEEFKNWFNQNDIGILNFNIKEIEKKNGEVIEKGNFKISFKDSPPIENAFYAKLIKGKHGWVFQEFKQINLEKNSSNSEHLKELKFLMGDWVDTDQDITVETHTKWDKYKNFLIQRFILKLYGEAVQEGAQIIGWDPNNQQIHSWIFDSDGGFGEGKWTQKGNSWEVKTTYTLPKGGFASADNTYTKIDSDHYSWSSRGREVNGEFLPDIKTVTIKRVKK